ncbi:hypothetical protein LSH36_108g01114 [Paralvinella palmiformis]|uniref:RRM domain-containing protein n=1 Tax=Paralvinella palmiformis TaxID=53620 RepID=A0AAD9JZN1_9ANNE|nr:hypothetical protein LSH36_108g01114 [Paralvinella palmiformis]
MPGNYKPFKEDVNSYKTTGIPCGNPRRYQSRAVIKMCPLTGRRRDVCLETPVEDIETEGDRQLQVLLKRQLNTDVNLTDELAKKRAFTEPVVYNVLDAGVAGPKTLSEFRFKELEKYREDELRQFGLTQDEIEFKLKTGNIETSQKSTGYGAHPAAIATKLKAIDEKIKAHQEMLSKPVSFSGTKTMTRHEMDLELAITHNEEKAKLLGSLLIEGNTLDPSYEDKNHPINHLDDILEEALTKRRPQSNHKLKDSAVESHSVVEEHSSVISKSDINNGKERRSTLEDKLEPMTEATCQPKPKVVKRSDEYIYLPESTDSKERLMGSSRVSEAKIRKINGHIDLIPEEAICRYRLSVQEIKKLDRFTNYEPGLPSNNLFLKNLSSKVTESDLVSLFHRYQKPNTPVKYRLMSGRMKGQAFVTLDSQKTAAEALNLINGYHFKGKPIIIQYGKQ